MVAREGQDIFHGKYSAYVCEGCEAVSPIAYSEEAAYTAATRTPPNRALTREQVEAMDDQDAVWIVRKGTGKICVGPAREAVAILISLEGYSRFWFFAALPTPADIEAAREKPDIGREERNENI
jgi:hypothetical protein